VSARLWTIAVPLLCLAACAERPADPPTPPEPPPASPSNFDPKACGTIKGVVRWSGDLPSVEPFRSIDEPLTDQPDTPPARNWPNPNAPSIHPTSRTLAGAIVFLRGVDPSKARPWYRPSLSIRLEGQTFRVHQQSQWTKPESGDFWSCDVESNVDFVRAGDKFGLVSYDDRLHVVQARGAAFFSLTLPAPGQVRERRLTPPGVVELTSGSGYFWMRAYVHVCAHPYYTRSDSNGVFLLDQVPKGDYDLVAWHPDWRVSGEERNPDLFRVQQVRFGAPLESSRRVSVRKEQRTDADVTLGAR